MAKAESFDNLIGSIQDAFLSVNELSEKQHLRLLEEYFDDDNKPTTINVQYPYFGDDGQIEYKSLDIPKLCLVPLSSLQVKEIDVEFKVKLAGKIRLDKQRRPEDANGLMNFSDGESDDKLGYVPEYRKSKDGNYADITLKFRADEPPEGLMRIRDELIKILP